MTGFVRYYNRRKQFGFIELDHAGVPVAHFYFHGLAVIGPAVDWGDEVEFLIGDGRRGGLVALQVRRRELAILRPDSVVK